jgi:hypothetical protein
MIMDSETAVNKAWSVIDRARKLAKRNDNQMSFAEMQPINVPKKSETKLTMQEQFEQFHTANPWVYDLIVSMARDLHERGRKKIGIAMLIEVMRWQYWRTTNDANSDFKINNNYKSRYARLVIEKNPDLSDMFELRELRSA